MFGWGVDVDHDGPGFCSAGLCQLNRKVRRANRKPEALESTLHIYFDGNTIPYHHEHGCNDNFVWGGKYQCVLLGSFQIDVMLLTWMVCMISCGVSLRLLPKLNAEICFTHYASSQPQASAAVVTGVLSHWSLSLLPMAGPSRFCWRWPDLPRSPARYMVGATLPISDCKMIKLICNHKTRDIPGPLPPSIDNEIMRAPSLRVLAAGAKLNCPRNQLGLMTPRHYTHLSVSANVRRDYD